MAEQTRERLPDNFVRREKKIKMLALLSLLLLTLIWGTSFAVMKSSIDSISPLYLVAYRFTVATVGLLIFFYRWICGMSKKEFCCGLIVGGILFVGYYFQTYGLLYTTASKNAFISTLYVVIVPFLHWFFNRIRPTWNNVTAALVAVVGLGLISLQGDMSIGYGDLLTLISSVGFAVQIVFLARYTPYCAPVRLAVMQMGTVAACSWIAAAVLEGTPDFSVFSVPGVASSVLYLGVACSMLGFLLQTISQKYLSPSLCSIVMSFESVFGLGFSVLLLHEPVTRRMLFGCLLMFAAAVLAGYEPVEKGDADVVQADAVQADGVQSDTAR